MEKWTGRASLGQTAWSDHPRAAVKGAGDECSALRKAEGPETSNLSSTLLPVLSTLLARDLSIWASISSHVNEQFYQRHFQL